MVRHLTLHQYDDDYAARPAVSDEDISLLIPAAVAQVLDVAETWLGWDGRPVFGSLDPSVPDTRPNENTWTIREVVHHVSHVTGYADTVGRLPVD